jgi:hypothetical protein
MLCPLCRQRKARRQCPGVGQQICAVCCGTKRLVEIRCPESCPYLASAREHPPAVEQRERTRDVSVLSMAMQDLANDRQRDLYVLLNGLLRRQAEDDPLRRPNDADVADAAAAIASTLETASRGIIYEQQPGTLPAQRILAAMKQFLEEASRQLGARAVDREAPSALRAVERGARIAATHLPGGDRAYLDLVDRLFRDAPESRAPEAAPEPGGEEQASRLILPPG